VEKHELSKVEFEIIDKALKALQQSNLDPLGPTLRGSVGRASKSRRFVCIGTSSKSALTEGGRRVLRGP
jgi:hypothetical protein